MEQIECTIKALKRKMNGMLNGTDRLITQEVIIISQKLDEILTIHYEKTDNFSSKH